MFSNLKYVPALVLVSTVCLLAWFIGRDNPIPAWIEHGLVPALGWVALALISIVILDLVLKARKRRLQADKENSRD